ncbi:MAG: ABC transporter ATP-binding protein/permease [Candidatus Cloacimonetes bacterium]|nr:ABC transporter ATP-binding protein/permease [Candidatus Cloacimonadota bacterium]
MPRQSFDVNADDLQGKIYDRELFRRLTHYLKPYLGYVVLSFVLLLVLAACTWTIPILTKTIVDNFITADRNLVVMESVALAQQTAAENKEIKFTRYGNNLLYPASRERYLSPELQELFKNSPDWWHKVIIVEASAQSLLPDSIRTIRLDLEELALPLKDYQKLKSADGLSAVQLQSLRSRDVNKIKHFGMIYLLIIIVQLFATFFQVVYINVAAQHAMYDLRIELFGHLEKMPTSFFDSNPVGRLVTRVMNDVRTLDEMLSNGLIQIIQDFVILIGIVITMFILSWKLALVCMLVVPLVILLMKVFRDKVRVVYREVRKRTAIINATLAEDLSGIKIINLFNLQRNKRKNFQDKNDDFLAASVSELKLYSAFRPFIWSFSRLSVAIILWYGGGLILQGLITIGIFMAFLTYMERFFEPINSIAERFNILQAAMSGAERIFDLMDKEPETDEPDTMLLENDLQGSIEFRNVWMAYRNEDWVLKDISFKVGAGEKIALVGHTGSGKTTIVSLLSRLYPIQKGEILLDGINLKDYTLPAIRSQIGIVQQDVFLFSGTIRDNIVLNKEMDDKELKLVAEMVNVDKFIEKLPGKYEEPVMERGATFSVGQRQLLAFARVLAYDPAIFIFDEATSNIDTETEILIQNALEIVMQDRTSLVIAHRLSTIKNADSIIVLHKGRIMEQGNHNELLEKRGFYYDLYRLQYQDN